MAYYLYKFTFPFSNRKIVGITLKYFSSINSSVIKKFFTSDRHLRNILHRDEDTSIPYVRKQQKFLIQIKKHQ